MWMWQRKKIQILLSRCHAKEQMSRNDWMLGELKTGKQLRDEGIAQVSDNNLTWMELCVKEAEMFARSWGLFTAEDIRFHCQCRVGLPRHHNAWGALTNVLIKRGIIEPTGEHRPMKDEISHARSTPVYRKK